MSIAPTYNETTQVLGVLQQIQRLLSAHPNATLGDVQQLLSELEHRYGPSTELESVIQQLVGQELRQAVRHRQQQKAVVVA